jgi:hypothetical protein
MGHSSSLESGNYGEGGSSFTFLQKLFHLSPSDIHSLHSIYSRSLNIEDSSSQHQHHSSRIHYLAFCSFIHCEENILTGYIFSFFSSFESHVNSLSFNEFILYLYFFLSLDEKSLIEFLYFLIIDHYSDLKRHHPHSRTPLTIEQSIHDLFGNDWGDSQQIHHILSIFDHDLHGELTFEQFQKGLQTNRSALFHIVSYQMDIKRKIFSESYWKRRTDTITPQIIRDIRSIRNQLHQLEREDFLLQTPPPPLQNLQLKPPDEVAESMDPRLVSLPVTRHKKDSHNSHASLSHLISHIFHDDKVANHDDEDDAPHLPVLSHPPQETTPLPAPYRRPSKSQHDYSPSLSEFSIPEESSVHQMFHPEIDMTVHQPPPPHKLHHSSTSYNEANEGSSHIHNLQKLKSLHHHHSAAELLPQLRPLYPAHHIHGDFPAPAYHHHRSLSGSSASNDINSFTTDPTSINKSHSPPYHHHRSLSGSSANNDITSFTTDPTSTHTVKKSHSLHHHHSNTSNTSSDSSK